MGRYVATFTCPWRGERSKEEACERLTDLGLHASWSNKYVRYEPKASSGCEYYTLLCLSITFHGEEPSCKLAAPAKSSSSKQKPWQWRGTGQRWQPRGLPDSG